MKAIDLIVCHRGIHDPDLLDKVRPVENSLAAYEKAWKKFTLCECDITVSKDGDLFLCHDETFRRVMAEPFTHPLASTPVSDLTTDQIRTIKLADGSVPPMLADVLEVAKSFGVENGARKLVVELKKDKASEIVTAKLCELLATKADLALHVGVVMSFDLAMMENLGTWRASLANKDSISHINLMLLTEAPLHFDPVNNTICADVRSPSFRDDCERIVKNNKLDGIYLEFQEEMITNTVLNIQEDKVQEELAALARNMPVGVWNYHSTQPDGLTTLERFYQLGLQFVNSDLPEDELILLGLGEKHNRASCFDAMWLFCMYGYGR